MKRPLPALIALIAACAPALADVMPLKFDNDAAFPFISRYKQPDLPTPELSNVVQAIIRMANSGHPVAQKFVELESLAPDPALDAKNSYNNRLKNRCDQTDATACLALYEIYEKGLFGLKDRQRALNYLGRAAELGSNRAMQTLAEAYEAGEGVPKDPDKARDLRERASKQLQQEQEDELKAIERASARDPSKVEGLSNDSNTLSNPSRTPSTTEQPSVTNP